MYKDTTTFPDLIDIGEAATLLHMHPSTLRRWDQKGTLKVKAIRLVQGGKRMYKRSDIEKLVQQ